MSVNRANLEAGSPDVVLVELPNGRLLSRQQVTLKGNVTLGRFDPPRPYGAVVGLTADEVFCPDTGERLR